MSDAVIIAISTGIASLVAVIIPQLILVWQNRHKIDDNSDLSKADLVVKYQSIANTQALANKDLEKEIDQKNILIHQKENEKQELNKKLDELYTEIKTIQDNQRIQIDEMKTSFETERVENEKIRNWAKRLVLQLQSYNITPTPFDVEDAKKKGLSLGDFGK